MDLTSDNSSLASQPFGIGELPFNAVAAPALHFAGRFLLSVMRDGGTCGPETELLLAGVVGFYGLSLDASL